MLGVNTKHDRKNSDTLLQVVNPYACPYKKKVFKQNPLNIFYAAFAALIIGL
jgi:hypothetical protein